MATNAEQAEGDVVSVHTENSPALSPRRDEEVVVRPTIEGYITYPMVQYLIREAHDIQKAEMDQRMQELMDHFTALIKPLEAAIGVLQSESLAKLVASEGGGSSHGLDKKRTSFKNFKSTSPPTFDGAPDPIKAVEWLDKMEECFDLADCQDSEKVRYAGPCLIKNAHMWWAATSKAMEPTALKELTWDGFKDRFEEKYCPLDRLDLLESQFMSLTQGDKTVTEYENEFLTKSLFAKHQVSTERRKIQRFVKGLRTEIRQFVRGRDISTFAKAVEAARDQEQELASAAADSLAPKRQRLTGVSSPSAPRSSFKYGKERAFAATSQASGSPTLQRSRGSKPYSQLKPRDACNRCGKYHKRACPSKVPLCYRCGEPDHLSFNCPRAGELCCTFCGEMGHTGTRCPDRKSRSESKVSGVKPATTVTPISVSAAFVAPRVRKPPTVTPSRVLQITEEEAKERQTLS